MSDKKRINVLYIDYASDFGGSPISLSEFVGMVPEVDPIILTFQKSQFIENLFSAYKHYQKTYIFSFGRKQSIESKLNSIFLSKLIKPILMKVYAAGSLAYSRWMSFWIARLIVRKNIQFVHVNNGPVYEAIRAAKIAKVPCVVHSRGVLTDKNIVNEEYSSVVASIGISKFVSQSLIDFGFSEDSVYTIHNSVNFQKYEEAKGGSERIRKSWGLGPEQVAIGIFGRVAPWKGQLEFLEAFNILSKVNEHVVAVIVGDSSDHAPEYFDSIKDFVEKNGIADRVIYTGFVSQVELYYCAVDIVVHASIEPEPFGRVIIEAMAAYKPIVAANDGGPKELIEHGETGFLVDPKDKQEMANLMNSLAISSELRGEISSTALKYALKGFSKENTAQKISRIYKDHNLV